MPLPFVKQASDFLYGFAAQAARARQLDPGTSLLVRAIADTAIMLLWVSLSAPLALLPYWLMLDRLSMLEAGLFAGLVVAAPAGLLAMRLTGGATAGALVGGAVLFVDFTVWALYSGGIQSPFAFALLIPLGLAALGDRVLGLIINGALLGIALAILSFSNHANLTPTTIYEDGQAAGIWLFAALLSASHWTALAVIVLRRRGRQADLLGEQAGRASADSRAKTDFLSTMSHEMRTPLNAITGMSEQLKLTDLDRRQKKAVEVIHNAGNELLARVENMMEISALDGGRGHLQTTTFAFGDLVRGVVDMIKPDLDQKGLSLTIDLSDDLAPFYEADTGRLGRVLMGLFDNAVKFTESGGVSIRIRPLHRKLEHHLLRIEIADTGIGITDDRRSTIFRAFELGDGSLSRIRQGAGLGLAVGDLIVKSMGGKLDYVSAPGKGTTFWFEIALPAVPVHGRPD